MWYHFYPDDKAAHVQLARVYIGRGQASACKILRQRATFRQKCVQACRATLSATSSLAVHPLDLARLAMELLGLLGVEDALAAHLPGLQGLRVHVGCGRGIIDDIDGAH